MKANKVQIIGIGADGAEGLAPRTLDLIRQAQFLAGGERHLAFFPGHPAEKFTVKSNLKDLVQRLKTGLDERRRMVVLASGDPLFYGIGGYLVKSLGAEHVDITPAVSAMQLAFAAAGLPWDEATLVSVHAKPLERLLPAAAAANVIGVFTEDGESPGRIARFLTERGLADFDAIVCERLGNPNQHVTRLPLSDLNGHTFDALNTLILLRRSPSTPIRPDPPLSAPSRLDLGLPEESFAHRKPKAGLITKSEIRILSVARLRLFPEAMVWDIGAGSGSVAIECARIARHGRVYAIEKNEDDIANVRENIGRFETSNAIPVHGRAPEILADVPDDPDAVFVGGSSGRMFDILDAVLKRLRPDGRVVLTLATIENLAETIDSLKKLDAGYELIQAQISRGAPILEMTRFEALNPVTIVTAWRKSS